MQHTFTNPSALIFFLLIFIDSARAIVEESATYQSSSQTVQVALDEMQGSGEWLIELQTEPAAKLNSDRRTPSAQERDATLARRKAIHEESDRVLVELQKLNLKVVRTNVFHTAWSGLAIIGASADDLQTLQARVPYLIRSYTPIRQANALIQDSMKVINAPAVWGTTSSGVPCGGKGCLTGSGIRIGIIDTGIDYTHSDLGQCFGVGCRVVDGYDFVNNDPDPQDDHGHGTHVAAIAAGNGVLSGVAPAATLYAYKVLNSEGRGPGNLILAALDRALDPNDDGDISDHLDVINLSLGFPFGGSVDDPYAVALDNLSELGVAVAVAAGNSGPSYMTLTSPALSRKAIAVAASCTSAQVGNDQFCNDPIASFSSRGPNTLGMIKPDISAPGVKICAAQAAKDKIWQAAYDYNGADIHCIDESHIAISGTSMATPHIAGVLALMRQKNPALSPAQLKVALKFAATSMGTDPLAAGPGLVDAFSAVFSPEMLPTLSVIPNFYSTIFGPTLIDYVIEPMQSGTLSVSTAPMQSLDFNNLQFSTISTIQITGDTVANVLSIPGIAGMQAELVNVEFLPDGLEKPFREQAISFHTPPNMAPGWPHKFDSPSSCLAAAHSAGKLRNDNSSDILLSFKGTCPFSKSILIDSTGSIEAPLSYSNESHNFGVGGRFVTNTYGERHLLHQGQLFDASLNKIFQSTNIGSLGPVMADLNADGNKEVIEIIQPEGSTGEGALHISSPALGYDLSIPFTSYGPQAFFSHGAYLAVGDLDNDGFPEIISSLLDVVSFSSNDFQTKPYRFSSDVSGFSGDKTQVAIADLDRNGWHEVLRFGRIGSSAMFEVYEQGKLKTAIELPEHSGPNFSEIVIADLDPAPGLEVVLATSNYIFVIGEGKIRAQTQHANFLRSPLYWYHGVFVLDTNGDGIKEILLPTDKLYIYDRNLTLLDDTFDLFGVGELTNLPTFPTFIDLDSDGDLELVTNSIGGPFNSQGASIFVWNTPFKTGFSGESWLRNGYDSGATRCFRCGTFLPSDLNQDGVIDGADLGLLLGAFDSQVFIPGQEGDLNNDGVVNSLDLVMLLGEWSGHLLSECSDGIDNDNDGEIDYPADVSCSTPFDIKEHNCGDGVCAQNENTYTCVTDCPLPACNDGADNDGDGFTDFPRDLGCSGYSDTTEFSCGNNACEVDENPSSCPSDCPITEEVVIHQLPIPPSTTFINVHTESHYLLWQSGTSIFFYDLGPDDKFNTNDDSGPHQIPGEAYQWISCVLSGKTIIWVGTDQNLYFYHLGADGLFGTDDDSGSKPATALTSGEFVTGLQSSQGKISYHASPTMGVPGGVPTNGSLFYYDLGPDGLMETIDDRPLHLVVSDIPSSQSFSHHSSAIVWVDWKYPENNLVIRQFGLDGEFGGDDDTVSEIPVALSYNKTEINGRRIFFTLNQDILGFDFGDDGIYKTADDIGVITLSNLPSYQTDAKMEEDLVVWYSSENTPSGLIQLYRQNLGKDHIPGTADDGNKQQLTNFANGCNSFDMTPQRVFASCKSGSLAELYVIEF